MTVFLFLMSLGVVAFSQLGPLWPNGEEERTPLLDLDSVNSSYLVELPPVGEAIRSFEERVRRTPGDFISYTILGQLHIRQARETGDVANYERAEVALRKALELLPDYSPAEAYLSSALYSQHSFSQALELAQRVYERDPKSIQALGTIGDAHLALGDYREARDAYRKLLRNGPAPPVLARLSRLKELEGNTEQSLQLMQRAADEALDSGGSRESMAWYLLRLGDLYFNAGRIDESAEHYEAALRVFDDYHLALAGLGRARAAQGRYDEAVDLYERVVAVIPQPVTLAVLGDLYAKTGDRAQAQLQYDTVEFIAKLATINEQVYNRTLVLFYA
ncbi:MAG: tetratricopeptide repeat protein, partial [Chloroflexi bacterium]|nr:tetratricopeptide repeat protein [Chloroflexota bacterium]